MIDDLAKQLKEKNSEVEETKPEYPRQVDWDNYNFRCSQLGRLMTNGRGSDGVGQTVYSLLQEIYLKEVWGYDKNVSTKQMEKGTVTEESAITLLYGLVYGQSGFIKKNTKRYSNDFIHGEPDVIVKSEKKVHDTKVNWDYSTFIKAEPTKDNIWQIKGYMWLLDFAHGEVDYCLVNTPKKLVDDEQYRLQFYGGYEEHDPELHRKLDQIAMNHNVDRVPLENRLKRFYYDRDVKAEKDIQERVVLCREILKKMTL